MTVELITIIILLSVDISEVSPSFGSSAGGTVLTVKGKGFDERATKVSVEVAGNTLIILSESSVHTMYHTRGLLFHDDMKI